MSLWAWEWQVKNAPLLSAIQTADASTFAEDDGLGTARENKPLPIYLLKLTSSSSYMGDLAGILRETSGSRGRAPPKLARVAKMGIG